MSMPASRAPVLTTQIKQKITNVFIINSGKIVSQIYENLCKVPHYLRVISSARPFWDRSNSTINIYKNRSDPSGLFGYNFKQLQPMIDKEKSELSNETGPTRGVNFTEIRIIGFQ
ncbi:hypothetical protein SAMN05216464_1047 [Mucilaginibacter pineti]|uniref:Uncharacterized protein n=1 Tax=Mucilaginibacter pineti TaxID=1391627 RepID=A0A1G7A8Z6_9SPHI|nr:hypothetical protein SAMN05216464_1047 [Mucilaginibacter pineti]